MWVGQHWPGSAYAVRMELRRTEARAAKLTVLPATDSTNTWLRDQAGRAPDAWPHGSVVVTTDQRSGRGRLERSWQDLAGKSLAVSLLLRPTSSDGAPLSVQHYGWLPLIAGLAVREAVADVVAPGVPCTLKWPNDLHLSGHKAAGILAELLSDGLGAIVGIGLNVLHTADELPLPGTASLVTAGAEVDDDLIDQVLADIVAGVLSRTEALVRAEGDAAVAGLLSEYRSVCSTLGRQVRVERAGQPDRYAEAVDIAADGQLLLREAGSDAEFAIASGDITHLRY